MFIWLLENLLMNKKKLFCLFLIVIITGSDFCVPVFGEPLPDKGNRRDPIKEFQILFNGKLWHNNYTSIKGDQFLFSRVFLPGSVAINGQAYKDVDLIYDIHNDEIITPTNHGTYIQLNKEMVDSFTLNFEFKTYLFRNTQADSLKGIKGYVNVLYKNKSALYVKYRKEIDLLAVDDKYDLFYQIYKIYFLKDGVAHQLTSKRDLFKILQEDKTKIREFMKKNKLRISKKIPESFIPVIRYYDSISQ